MLHILAAESEFTDDFRKGVVVIESDCPGPEFGAAFAELNEVAARNQALGFAAQRGMADPRINGNVIGPYPVNAEGRPLDQVTDDRGRGIALDDPRMRPHRYRIEVPVVHKLV